MKIIKEPRGVDFTVVPRRFTDEEANELLEHVKKNKAARQKQVLEVKITAANPQELEFLLALFKKLNVKWTLVGG